MSRMVLVCVCKVCTVEVTANNVTFSNGSFLHSGCLDCRDRTYNSMVSE